MKLVTAVKIFTGAVGIVILIDLYAIFKPKETFHIAQEKPMTLAGRRINFIKKIDSTPRNQRGFIESIEFATKVTGIKQLPDTTWFKTGQDSLVYYRDTNDLITSIPGKDTLLKKYKDFFALHTPMLDKTKKLLPKWIHPDTIFIPEKFHKLLERYQKEHPLIAFSCVPDGSIPYLRATNIRPLDYKAKRRVQKKIDRGIPRENSLR